MTLPRTIKRRDKRKRAKALALRHANERSLRNFSHFSTPDWIVYEFESAMRARSAALDRLFLKTTTK